MTVLRREDVHSKVASWDSRPYRIVRSPILAIVPLIIRRLRGPFTEPHPPAIRSRISPRVRARQRLSPWCCDRLERGPQEARQLTRNSDRDSGRGLVVFRQPSEPPTQSLLRFVGNRDHTAWLTFASSRERHPDARPVLIVPRGFD